MKRWFPVPAMLALCACQAVPAGPPPTRLAERGALIVCFKPDTPPEDRAALRHEAGVDEARALVGDAELWPLSQADEAALISRLGEDAHVKFAYPNRARTLIAPLAASGTAGAAFRLTSLATPDDPGFSRQWNLLSARFPQAWERATGRGVTVAVVDSGVDPDHPDLKGHLLPLIDELAAFGIADSFQGAPGAGHDTHGHGTHVCGIIGAVAGNGVGISGAAPDVTILPIKVADSRGDGSDAVIAKGIADAVDHGAQVINLSIGGTDPSPLLLEAINYAFNRHVVTVIAAGNDGGAVNYPAAYAGVLSVGGLTHRGDVATYSSHGRQLAIVAPGGGGPGGAPGDEIYSTTPTYPCTLTDSARVNGGYGYLSGTSMAAPLVTAAVALLLQQEPSLPPAQVWTRLAASADRPDAAAFDEFYGFGSLDARAALDSGSDDRRPN